MLGYLRLILFWGSKLHYIVFSSVSSKVSDNFLTVALKLRPPLPNWKVLATTTYPEVVDQEASRKALQLRFCKILGYS